MKEEQAGIEGKETNQTMVGARRKRKSVLVGFVMVLGAITVFSTIEVVVQVLQEDMKIAPLAVMTLRFGIGGLALCVVALFAAGWSALVATIRRDGWKMLGLGGGVLVVTFLFYHWSLKLTSSMMGGVIFSVNPAIVTLAAVALGRERLDGWKVAAICAGIMGVASCNWGGRVHAGIFPHYAMGNLVMFLAVIGWTVFWLGSAPLMKKYPTIVVSGVTILFAGTVMALIFVLVDVAWGRKSVLGQGSITLRGVLLLAYLGLVTIGVAYYLLYAGIARTGVSRGMVVFFLKPPLVGLVAHVAQSQPVSSGLLVSMVLAAGSVGFIGLSEWKRAG